MKHITTVVCLGLLFACGGPDFSIGPTDFYKMEDNVQVWEDLPEAVFDMQQVTAMPADAWDKDVFLYPGGEPTRLGAHIACFCDPMTDHIQARTTDADRATIIGCIPHEFAHKWHIHSDPAGAQADPHGEAWAEKFGILEAAASDTWLARRMQQ